MCPGLLRHNLWHVTSAILIPFVSRGGANGSAASCDSIHSRLRTASHRAVDGFALRLLYVACDGGLRNMWRCAPLFPVLFSREAVNMLCFFAFICRSTFFLRHLYCILFFFVVFLPLWAVAICFYILILRLYGKIF